MLQQALANSDTANIQYWRSQITYLSVNTNPTTNNTPDGGEIGVLTEADERFANRPGPCRSNFGYQRSRLL